jgi:hypothetical protein
VVVVVPGMVVVVLGMVVVVVPGIVVVVVPGIVVVVVPGIVVVVLPGIVVVVVPGPSQLSTWVHVPAGPSWSDVVDHERPRNSNEPLANARIRNE